MSSLPKILQPGYRLGTSVTIFVLAFLFSPWHPAKGSRIVFAWDMAVGCLLTLIVIMMWRTPADRVVERARREETSNMVVVAAIIVAVAGALVDIGHDLPEVKGMSDIMRVFDICQSILGVFLAWLLLHFIHALQYAKVYYAETGDGNANKLTKGLAFPGNTDVLDYWDFVYYAFTIGMCFQTSDVTVTSPYMRRLTIFHAIVSYLFALAILGLLLNGFISNI